ncbi:MAG: diaminopimelate epimerase [Acidobacteriota bacterium]|nr:diaminopimelate epimerase [Acidobacteriota bacterium]
MDRGVLRLTKHHGAGNDFLVLLDAEGRRPLSRAEVAALCDRRRGVGADGVLRGLPGTDGARLRMELRNADGSVAEMSGNGIRCLVQAAVAAGWASPGEVAVDTDAGRRTVTFTPGPGPGLAHAEVAMGRALLGDELVLGEPAALERARAVDMGNPHVVLLLAAPPGDDDVTGVGARLEASVAGGANVEFLWAEPEGGEGAFAMRVWERGVGETLACGTGTCAAAAAVASWGLAAGPFRVRNPGGVLEVTLTEAGAVLGGPTAHVADVVVAEAVLAAMAEAAGTLSSVDEVAAPR